jgi:predicted component of type VI protein secretion system
VTAWATTSTHRSLTRTVAGLIRACLATSALPPRDCDSLLALGIPDSSRSVGADDDDGGGGRDRRGGGGLP